MESLNPSPDIRVPRAHRSRAAIPWVASLLVHGLIVAIGINVSMALQPAASVAEEMPLFSVSAATGSVALESMLDSPVTPNPPSPTVSIVPESSVERVAVPASPRPEAAVSPIPSSAQLPRAATRAPAGSDPVTKPVTFAGLRAVRAKSVEFVIDASGSMIGAMPQVLDELERALDLMEPDQKFRVLFFQKNGVAEAPGSMLKPATAANRAEVLSWARTTLMPLGKSSPLAAMEQAIGDRPDVIFLLASSVTGMGSSGVSSETLMERLEVLNPVHPSTGRRAVQIQCIQVLDSDESETLQAIAQAHSGSKGYRFISRVDLGLKAP